MQIRKAQRSAAKLRIGISGPTGAGKTYGSLKLAFGMTNDWSKIVVIDTENNSADLYADLGDYSVLPINDYSPATYAKAIKACEEAGFEVIIIDSTTHEWEWCCNTQIALGGAYKDWGTVKSKYHRPFKTILLNSTCHIIACTRSKMKHEMVENETTKRMSVQKLGVGLEAEPQWEYELTVNFDLNQEHIAFSTKDRTRLFAQQIAGFELDEKIGKDLIKWANEGGSETEVEFNKASLEINNASTKDELILINTKFKSLKDNLDFKNLLKERLTEIENNK